MSMDYIRRQYRMSVKRGDRVLYSGSHCPRFGVVTGSKGARLRIRLEGDKKSGLYHPTWLLCVLTRFAKEAQP